MQASFVEIQDLVFSRNERTILKGINLTARAGKITAIMGPSGSGKTSLLRLIGGLLQPDSGFIWVSHQNIQTLSMRELQAFRKNMGFLFQNHALFTDLSVFENVAFPLRAHTTWDEATIRLKVLEKLESVGLKKAADLMPEALSGGMARRVALARALILEPKLMLYDEPFTGQDPISIGVLMRLIVSMNESFGTTSILVSHDVDETCKIADFIYVLSEGRILSHGSPKTLQASNSPGVQQFMRGEADGPVPFHYKGSLLSPEELDNAQ